MADTHHSSKPLTTCDYSYIFKLWEALETLWYSRISVKWPKLWYSQSVLGWYLVFYLISQVLIQLNLRLFNPIYKTTKLHDAWAYPKFLAPPQKFDAGTKPIKNICQKKGMDFWLCYLNFQSPSNMINSRTITNFQ